MNTEISLSVYLDPWLVMSGGGPRERGRQVRNRVYAVYSVALGRGFDRVAGQNHSRKNSSQAVMRKCVAW